MGALDCKRLVFEDTRESLLIRKKKTDGLFEEEEISQMKCKLSKQEVLGNTEAGYGATYL